MIYSRSSDKSRTKYIVHSRYRYRKMRGSVTFVTMIIVLGLALLIGYVGNMGAEILRRQHLQNAADAVAYSSALCMARGMNAICAYNHIMGELTSLIVILEALGGPEADKEKSETFSTTEDMTLNVNIVVSGKIPGIYFDGFTGGRFDKALVDNVVEKVSKGWRVGNYSMGEHHCGAAIYDAQYALKKQIAAYLIAKIVGSGLQVCKPIPIVGPGLWATGTAAHVAANIQLGRILPEMIILDVLHGVVPKIAFIKNFIRNVLPYMSCVPEAIAGIGDPPTLGSVKFSLEQTQNTMKDFYRLEVCVVNNRRLPVEREKEPEKNSGTKNEPVVDVDDDSDTSNNENEKNLKKEEGDDDDQLNESVTKAQKEVNALLAKKNFLDEEKKKASEQGREPFEVWTKEDDKKLENAKQAVQKTVLTRNQTLQIKKQQKAEMASKINQVKSRFTQGNPSNDKLESFDKDTEKKSQWVRASYPYINDIRNKLNSYFNAPFIGLTMCKMSKHFNKWVERYTLNESYCIRSKITRKSDGSERKPSFMLLMKDSTGDTKGKENWTKNAETADVMFAVTAVVAEKDSVPLMGKEIFKRGRKNSDIAVAQAMFYNANDCDTAKSSKNGCQPNISWDTLQWEPQNGFIVAPECFSGQKDSGNFEIWNLFSSRKTESNDGSKVRLNWQAKLSPVTLNSFIKDAQIPPQIKQDCNVIYNNKTFLTH
jgi:hypothetical protein